MKSGSKIPPDFDVMFVNIGFGSLLSTYSSKLFQTWKAKNSKFSHVFEAPEEICVQAIWYWCIVSYWPCIVLLFELHSIKGKGCQLLL